ncbi:unnamed protein product [Plasmodium vivax]|uniref:(malaria parasite P. vivax) hypothetical protein n=1 Tax=Plasmodium vivax TaxID=5855 RepID=A0A8S4HIS5_PLAVI|nr:unnamed protein product [Plasmodium vivax]
MAVRRGTPYRYAYSFRNYKQPECITKYYNYQQEIQKQIDELKKINQKHFCRRCQGIRKNILDKHKELKYCYDYDLLRNRLIDDGEIKDFLGKCLQPSECSYNGTSNVRNSSTLKRESENACEGKKDCNKGAAPPQVLAGKLQQVLNPQSSRTNIPARQENLNIEQPHAERGGSTKANPTLDHKKNISITNDSVVVQPEATDHKGIHPYSTSRELSIPEQPPPPSQHSLPSELDNSSNDSSPRVNPGSESREKAIAEEKDSEAFSLGNDQHGPQYVRSSALVAQELRSTTSAGQNSDVTPLDSKISGAGNLDEKPTGGEDRIAITLGDINSGSRVVDNFAHRILDLGRDFLNSTLTDDRGGGGSYVNQTFFETPVNELLPDESIGDNSETPFKKYTAMALAPTGIIMLMTLLTKFTPLGMLFTKKNRNKRNDMKENIERILLLESPAKTEESSYSFAYSPSQYWET